MPDDRLGMHEPISRRDFLNGTLLASAGLVLGRPFQAPATLSPAEAWNGYGGVGDYARAHGNMYDVMTTAHRLRDGAFDRAIANAIDTGEMYDLVVVGGGGGAAVWCSTTTRSSVGRRSATSSASLARPLWLTRARRSSWSPRKA